MAVHKRSRQREAIKANLMQRYDHPTADMIYADIREKYPNISLGRVYRNLSLLTEIGEVRRMTTEGGADRYDGNVEPHTHFYCRVCGDVRDLAPVDGNALKQMAGREFDGVIEESKVTFIGICGRCARTAANS